MRVLISLIVACLCFIAPAGAAEIPIPSQAQWAEAKKVVDLPNGTRLAYVVMGNSTGKPLLLIHGFTDNSRTWSLLAPYLKSRQIFAIDLRGHGKSSAPECCYAAADLADDVYVFLNTMGIARADVIGHSLGSMTAQMLAAQHPEKVGKLVLISSSLRPGRGPGSWMWDNIMPLKAPIDPDGKFMTDWYWNPNPVDQDFIDHERRESAAVPLQVWHGVMWGLSSYDFTALAPTIKAPMLILWGDKDQLFDAPHQKALRKAYPKAQRKTFKGGGHNMFWEFPQQVAVTINAFLDKP